MWLAYSGALPFVFCAALMALGHRHIALVGELSNIINTYSLVIIVFMSGIYWGLYFNGQIYQKSYLLIISNIITILSWLAFLFIDIGVNSFYQPKWLFIGSEFHLSGDGRSELNGLQKHLVFPVGIKAL